MTSPAARVQSGLRYVLLVQRNTDDRLDLAGEDERGGHLVAVTHR
jgi:hypothetical protein